MEVKADPVLTATQDNSKCNRFKGKTGRRLQQDTGEKNTQERWFGDAVLEGAPKGGSKALKPNKWKLDMAVHTCYPSNGDRRQEAQEFQASLSYTVSRGNLPT